MTELLTFALSNKLVLVYGAVIATLIILTVVFCSEYVFNKRQEKACCKAHHINALKDAPELHAILSDFRKSANRRALRMMITDSRFLLCVLCIYLLSEIIAVGLGGSLGNGNELFNQLRQVTD